MVRHKLTRPLRNSSRGMLPSEYSNSNLSDVVWSSVIVSWTTALIRDMANRRPVLTAGGRREAEMATPTPPAWLPPRTARATPTPLGTAMKTPTTRQLQPVRPSISVVGQLGEETASRFRDLLSFKTKTQPNRNPTSTQMARAYSSLFGPIRMSFLFLMA